MSSLAYNFSSGSLYAVRNDSAAGANPTPVKFGVLQDCQVDFAGTNKNLIGQYSFPVDVARGEIKVTFKAKSAQIFSNYFDLFLGDGVTPATALDVAVSEAGTVPATSTYVITVAHNSTFTQDLGVLYAATGIPLTHVASLTAVGQYTVSAGVYTFYSGDASTAMLLSYEYTGTTGNEIVMTNQLMGTAPTFIMVLATTYKGNIMNVHFNQCISEKLSIPVKNTDYTILEFDGQAYCDAANNLGKLTLSQ